MKRKLLILLFIIFSILLFAQIPEWQWATAAGGIEYDAGYGIEIDDIGNCYITGVFEDIITLGSFDLISNGQGDIFVAMIDANGNWQWATRAGGIEYDSGNGIIIDDVGNSYITGRFENTATFGPYSITSNGNVDIFVAKIDSYGNWQWVIGAGGNDFDIGYGITIDNFGNSYVVGSFRDTAIFGSYSLSSSGGDDIFVAKIDSIGNWQWATRSGGNGYDVGKSITIDDNRNSYVTGCFEDISTFGADVITSSGEIDIFVAKINEVGNWLWVSQAGGTNFESGYGISIDHFGNSYIIGDFSDFSVFGTHSLTSSGYFDIFVAKLSNSVSAENEMIPTKIRISNIPNPFNPSTTVSFNVIQTSSFVNLSIFNIKGQLTKILANNEFTKGSHSIIWNGDDELGKSVSSGIYYYKLNVNGKTEAVKKCLLLK